MRELNIPENINGKILSTLKNNERDLPVALKRLANYILDNADLVISSNLVEIAKGSNVGEATVVRLAKTLHYPGFKEFQLALAMELAGANQKQTEEEILDSNIEEGDDCGVIARKLKISISQSLDENIKKLDPKTLGAVADAIFKARKVYIVGVGNSCLSALFLKNKLCRIGIDATSESLVHFMYTSLVLSGPSDVVIAISQKGNSFETRKAFQIGKESGALTIALTNAEHSNLAKMADYVILNGNEEGALQGDSAATITAQLHLCELIYDMVVAFNKTKATKTKQLTIKALNKELIEDFDDEA